MSTSAIPEKIVSSNAGFAEAQLNLWDRLFGTFAPEVEPVVYGLTKDIDTFHPGRIAFHEFAAIGRDVAQAPGLSAKLGYLLAPPGWSHDGSSQTATQLQRAVRRTRTGM